MSASPTHLLLDPDTCQLGNPTNYQGLFHPSPFLNLVNFAGLQEYILPARILEEHLDVFSGNSDHACTRLYAGGDAHQLSMSILAILTREDSLIEPLSRTSLRMVGVKFS